MKQQRLVEVDALRGIAAVMVMLFHYTYQYNHLFGHTQPLTWSVPWGYVGVHLFFMISGFVIFMTLERCKKPLDFWVSRFSRLYPAYWVAMLLTFAITHALGLPGKVVDTATLIKNIPMFQGWFNVKPVDAVYWTLQVELIFYILAFIAWCVGMLSRVHIFILMMLALRLIYVAAHIGLGIDLPYVLTRFLMLDYIAFFAIGIMIYRLTVGHSHQQKLDWLVITASLATIGLTESLWLAAICVGFALLLFCASRGFIPFLRLQPFLWLGAISYSLYLTHENIGWALLRRLEQAGLGMNTSIAIVSVLMLCLATTLTYLIEKPAMRIIRNAYKKHA